MSFTGTFGEFRDGLHTVTTIRVNYTTSTGQEIWFELVAMATMPDRWILTPLRTWKKPELDPNIADTARKQMAERHGSWEGFSDETRARLEPKK